MNSFDLGALKANLLMPENKEFHKIFKRELKELIDHGGVSREAHEKLTGFNFDDEISFREHLSQMYQFLFENGPLP